MENLGLTWAQFIDIQSGLVDAISFREEAIPIPRRAAVGFSYHGKTHYRTVKNWESDRGLVTIKLGEGLAEKPDEPIMWLVEPCPGTGYLSSMEVFLRDFPFKTRLKDLEMLSEEGRDTLLKRIGIAFLEQLEKMHMGAGL